MQTTFIFIVFLGVLNIMYFYSYFFIVGEDSCGGDSGGPLMLEKKNGFRKKYTLIGLVSWGTFKCATERFPGVYTDVASFLPWILDHLE